MSVDQLRLPQGGAIDRSRVLAFRWNGRLLQGHPGDTLASALLASGERLVARSFKLHRPRGLMAAGLEEANALVEVGPPGIHQPNLRATEVLLQEGLEVRSQHAWPSLRWDAGALIDRVARFLPAGFYYKTFRWPSWHVWEPSIRRAAGLGRAPFSPLATPAIEQHAHTQVLVVGSGPAGLSAAWAAAQAGHRVWLVERDSIPGGCLNWRDVQIDGVGAHAWRDTRWQALMREFATGQVTLLTSTLVAALFGDHRALLWRASTGAGDAGTLTHLRCDHIVLASGASERPLVFADNDRPGIMLASAACEYARRYGVAIGHAVVVLTSNDDGWRSAAALEAAGVAVVALLDTRADSAPSVVLRVPVTHGVRVIGTTGRHALRSVIWRDTHGRKHSTACDALAVSGGWQPIAMLASHAGAALRWNDDLHALLPPRRQGAVTVVGAAYGVFDVQRAMADGAAWADLQAPAYAEAVSLRSEALTVAAVPGAAQHRQWIDLQNDVTVADIALAVREGMRSIEHVKRYTTLGMAPDQGRTSQVNGLEQLAAQLGDSVSSLGNTRPRPPVFPLPLAALAGPRRGALYKPLKQLVLCERHQALGAVFEEYGGWWRPAAYLRAGEDEATAVQREASQARTGVVLMDASPLGKIEVIGADAAEFLERVYATGVASLAPGRARYGLMLNDRGIIIDDGVLACLSPSHYLVGTTSGAASRILRHLEEWHQTEWPDLDVTVHDATAQWGVVTVSGPQARVLLQRLHGDIDFDPAAFPHLSVRCGQLAGASARVQRVSFTGERSYEIALPRQALPRLWDLLWSHGQDLGVAPLGIEALMVLRIEKGYLHVGSETDATTIPDDIGFGAAIRRKSMLTIGRRGVEVPAMMASDRLQLVGLRSADASIVLPVGAHVLPKGVTQPPARSEGHVTSSVFSPTLKRGVALAMLRDGRARVGHIVSAWASNRCYQMEVVVPCALDSEGRRLRDDD